MVEANGFQYDVAPTGNVFELSMTWIDSWNNYSRHTTALVFTLDDMITIAAAIADKRRFDMPDMSGGYDEYYGRYYIDTGSMATQINTENIAKVAKYLHDSVRGFIDAE